MPTPTWLAATTGQATKAGQVNQFLGAHAATLVYQGAQTAAQSTAGTGGTNSNSLWIAQSFTTAVGQTAIGRVAPTFSITGTPTTPLTVAIYASSGGAPSGSPLVTTLLPQEFLSGTPTVRSIPLPCTVTASTTYWIVTQADGDPSNFYTWSKSNQVSGASTSTNGTTWTAQAYGLLYQVFDQTVTPPIKHTWEDTGARWTSFGVDAFNRYTSLFEFTQGQTATGYLASVRTLAYTSGVLTSVT